MPEGAIESFVAAWTHAAAQVSSMIDRSAFDVDALARSLGTPERAFAFVRDEVLLDPYVGTLRGAAGTLAGRAGNALDQSLLLAALVTRTGAANVRLAYGALDAPTAARLFAAAFTRSGFAHVTPPPPREDPTAQLAAALGVAEADLRATALEQQRAGHAQFGTLTDTATADAAVVAQGLETIEIDFVRGAAEARVEVVRGLRAHTWVRYDAADGTTVDLDPAFPDATAGATFTAADGERAEPAADACHTVDVRLVLDQREDDKLHHHVLWERRFSGGAVTTSLRFEVVPEGVDPRTFEGDASALRAAAEASTAFQILLRVDGADDVSRAFDRAGNLVEVANGRSVAASFDALGGVLGGLFGPPPPQRSIAALRVELVTVRPTPSGPARRDHSSTLLTVDGPPDAELIHRLLIAGELGLTGHARSRAALVAAELAAAPTLQARIDNVLAAERGAAPPHPTAATTAAAPPTPLTLAWALLAEDLAAWRSNPIERIRVYYDRPRIVVFVQRIVRAPDGRHAAAAGFDVVDNRWAYVGSGDGDGDADDRAARAFALIQGSLETLLEAHLLGDAPVANAHATFLEAVRTGATIAVLVSARASEVDALALDPAAKRTIHAALAAGAVVLVPTSALIVDGNAQLHLWRWDPIDGSLLGLSASGAGSAFAEYLTANLSLRGFMTGMITAALICAYIHRDDPLARTASCILRALITELLIVAAVLTLGPYGAVQAAYAILGIGGVLLAAGLAMGNEQLIDTGFGFVFTVVFAAGATAIGPYVGAGFRRLADGIRTALGRPALVPQLAAAGSAIVRSSDNVVEGATVMFARRPQRAARATVCRPSEIFEQEIASLIKRDPATRAFLENLVDETLPQMVGVVRGQFNNAGHGVDIFARDAAGNLYVIEVSLGHLGEKIFKWVKRAEGVQMSPEWVAEAIARFRDADQALPRLRALMPECAHMTDAELRAAFDELVGRGVTPAVIVPVGIHVSNQGADHFVDWRRDVYTVPLQHLRRLYLER